jgi:hypothetical protein
MFLCQDTFCLYVYNLQFTFTHTPHTWLYGEATCFFSLSLKYNECVLSVWGCTEVMFDFSLPQTERTHSLYFREREKKQVASPYNHVCGVCVNVNCKLYTYKQKVSWHRNIKCFVSPLTNISTDVILTKLLS